MNESDLAKLKPTAQTGAEIRAALARIAAAKTSIQSRINDIRAEMEEKQNSFSLSSVAKRKFTDAISDLEQEALRLDALAAEIETPLAKIEAAERAERLGAEFIALEAEKASLDATWEAEYPALHKAIKTLLSERNDFIRRAVGKGLGLGDFEVPSQEIRLLKSPEQRAYDATPYWLHETRALAAANEARRAAREAVGPRILDDSPPKPTLTVGGVAQDITGSSWR